MGKEVHTMLAIRDQTKNFLMFFDPAILQLCMHSIVPSPPPPTHSGYSNLMIRDPPTAAVSSKDFADIMENLQNSRNVIQDPSRALAFSMYHCECI